jgi:enediyne biosynthesis protein E4
MGNSAVRPAAVIHDRGRASAALFAVWVLIAGLSGCDSNSDSDSVGPVDVRDSPGNVSALSVPETDRITEREANRSKSSSFAHGIELIASPRSQVVHSTHFTTVSPQCGIDFTYQNGANGSLLMVEATGGGCGWLDFDGDGLSDLYLIQGGDPSRPASPSQPADRLFRNSGNGQFEDVTEWVGIDERMYGQGIAVGDYDNDGFDDILVTNVGRDSLYHNEGDGTFSEVASASVGSETLWSSSAAWGDIDRDGDLDLYVSHYVDFDPFEPKLCRTNSGEPATCHPKEIEPCPDEFYLNSGDGTFLPVASRLGLSGPGNRALGVVIADFDNDDWPDIYVANDTTDNFLFMNNRGQQFDEKARLFGAAVNINGSPQASMGIAAGDYDGNGYLDLYLSHFHNEWNTLLQNLGPTGFHDVTAANQLAVPTMATLGFGTVMQDFDHNGWLELFVANGHIDDLRDDGIDLEMKPQLFAFNGQSWDDRSQLVGEYCQQRYLGRAVATADFDNDGDLDVAFVSQNQPTVVLRNDSEGGHWLNVKLVGVASNRRGIGTRISIRCGERTFTQELAGGTSYCAAHQSILSFGFGDCGGPYALDVRWPNGARQLVADVAPNQLLVLQEPVSEVR